MISTKKRLKISIPLTDSFELFRRL